MPKKSQKQNWNIQDFRQSWIIITKQIGEQILIFKDHFTMVKAQDVQEKWRYDFRTRLRITTQHKFSSRLHGRTLSRIYSYSLANERSRVFLWRKMRRFLANWRIMGCFIALCLQESPPQAHRRCDATSCRSCSRNWSQSSHKDDSSDASQDKWNSSPEGKANST